ncbi:MAG: hypothetical protein ACW987_15685 [Candidatus Thorarchaeota archaeon]|jgi:hypothetical protein
MANYTRSGDCLDCGDCCGGNETHPDSLGWEYFRTWDMSDIQEAKSLWTLFGLGYNPVTERVEPESQNGFKRITGTQYWFTWQELREGKGHLPCKDISAGHSGSPFSVECPFLEDDPGDGTRPCALKGTQDEGARTKYCRPEERPEPPASFDTWSEQQVQEWNLLHPGCSYTFEEQT